MIFEPALAVLFTMAAVMVAAWAFGLWRRNGGWTDVFWTWGSGATLTTAALVPLLAGGPPEMRQLMVAAMVAIWTLRLGLFLTPRVASHPEDPRYAAFREQWGPRYPLNMLFVTLPQAPASALLSLSVITAARTPGPLGWRDALGVAIFLAGIVGEAIADGQMKAFRATGQKGAVMDRGLWAWSRHPNYFFQWLGWVAYPVIALQPAWPVSWISLAAPVVMFGLLRYVSGVPPLETVMLASRGEKFRDYQRRVSAFFPRPPKVAPSPANAT
jgi:steroid 5-alpha reductase family enzyme